jgi:hypothetical protein
VVFNATRVDTNPPSNTMKAPYGLNDSAAFIIPNSPCRPINCHEDISGNRAPIETKAIRQYMITTRASEMKIALGMFLLGFLTSSPV